MENRNSCYIISGSTRKFRKSCRNHSQSMAAITSHHSCNSVLSIMEMTGRAKRFEVQPRRVKQFQCKISSTLFKFKSATEVLNKFMSQTRKKGPKGNLIQSLACLVVDNQGAHSHSKMFEIRATYVATITFDLYIFSSKNVNKSNSLIC